MGNSIEPNTKEYYQLQSEYWFNECCKCTNACNELINDMAEVKRKAEAFNEIKEYTLDKIETLTTRQEFAPNSNDFEYFGNLLTAFKAIKYKISDLERGSDDNRN